MLNSKKLSYSNIEFETVTNILEEYGGSHVSHLIYLKDKKIFITANHQVIITYQKIGNKLVVLGDPIGKKDALPNAILEFDQFCASNGYTAIYYQISPEFLSYYHEVGYRFFKLGEEAIVSLSSFNLDGKKGAKLRTRRNKFIKQGYQFNVLRPPYTDELLAELRKVSNSWLSNRKEKCFSVSFFSEEYVSQFPISILQNPEGEIIAFATLAIDEVNGHKTVAIDLMRHVSNKPHGTMDKLFISILFWAKENGYDRCSLGMAPLANVGTHSASFLHEKLARMVARYGDSFYSFHGLREYKGKFADRWEPKYLAYKKSPFIIVILQIFMLVHKRVLVTEQTSQKTITMKRHIG
jgi:phosphatidylglycerol lysyltransferase